MKGSRSSDIPIAIHISNIRDISKYHFPSRVGIYGKNKVNLEHIVPESKEGDMSKGYSNQTEKNATGYIKNKFENQYQESQ